MPKNNRRNSRKQNSTQTERDADGAGGRKDAGRPRSKVKGRNHPAGAVFTEEKDITLDAFANNACRLALVKRTSKAATMSHEDIKRVASVGTNLITNIDEEEVLDDWYKGASSSEEEEDQLEDSTTLEEGSEDCGGAPETDISSEHLSGPANGSLKKGTKSSSPNVGQVYPSIIWYLVSAFVYPEDVGTFARLCRDTQALTNTAAFWRRLYFRFYNSDNLEALPKELHPTSIQRTFGLRSLVIRSLQYLYPPFVRRNAPRGPTAGLADGRDAAEELTGMVFMYHVSRAVGPNHVYCMKFRRADCDDGDGDDYAAALPRDPDIFRNRQRGQCLLTVVCKHLHHIEPEKIMGKELAYAALSVSTGMTYNRLRLEFQEPAAKRGRYSSWTGRSSERRGERTGVVLDPVLYARVYHWWHPHFQEETFQADNGNIPSTANLNMWNAT